MHLDQLFLLTVQHIEITRDLKYNVKTNNRKSFIHFYCKMLFVKLQAVAIWNNDKWKIAGGCDALWWIDESFFLPTERFAGIFIFVMTSINQHECVFFLHLLMEEKGFVYSPSSLPSSHALTSRVQIYIFHLFSICKFQLSICLFHSVKYCYCCSANKTKTV